jgi:Flp pilus assembly protein TadB
MSTSKLRARYHEDDERRRRAFWRPESLWFWLDPWMLWIAALVVAWLLGVLDAWIVAIAGAIAVGIVGWRIVADRRAQQRRAGATSLHTPASPPRP